MTQKTKIIKEWVDVQVTEANKTFKESFEVDKNVQKIIGIAITSNYNMQMYLRGSQRISINDQEIYPEDYESLMLMQGLNVSANDRIIKLEQETDPGNRKVEIDYKDSDHPDAAFVPYRVRLYVFSKVNA